MQRSDFRLLERLRVRWAEIDAQQIVFNGHYLMYFDTAIAAYWRAMAMPYGPTLAELGGDLFVRKATIDYRAPARYDDVLDVGLRCARVGNSSIRFDGAVFLQDRCLVTGELVYVFADAQQLGSAPVPSALRDALGAFESGASMVDVQVGDWSALGQHARPIRTSVFIDEQRIPRELEWDDADATARHAVAFNRFGAALATGRLLVHAPGIGRIGRMATLKSMRGAAIGRAVLDALVDAARARGDGEVRLHAQTAAQRFYARAGFAPLGAVFEEAGIAHIEMSRRL